MNIFKQLKGIEIIMIVVMIGILVSVVRTSLYIAKTRDTDGAIIFKLGKVQSAALLYYQTNGNYGGGHSVCTEGMFKDSVSGMAAYTDGANYPNGLLCNSTNLGYAVEALLTEPGQYWCVDSAGKSIKKTEPISGPTCL
ncbi:MAG: hypothetical protein JWN89_761 [Parcubacteria group bacterium]|nr:hypothetical protein [Parcubacteria group bacterium]